MKPKKIHKKLNLNKSTVSNLNNPGMSKIKGGLTGTCTGDCSNPSECKTNCPRNCDTQEISVCYCETDLPACNDTHWLICPVTEWATCV